ncbi:DNA double-strand break repair nuclease NurA [Nitrososphaera sp.]|uniref:DNA double-strand break repair nuclease NurA n=1 Tax=Nitrososphaera sp. TaxID=1971748 RepID=UPI0031748921
MLREVYLDALRNREKKVSKIKDANHGRIVAEASSRWIPYEPVQQKCESAGVDSSWNKRAFQGLNLYVIDAVAVTSANKVLASEFEDELADSARRDSLESKAMLMEASVAQKAAEGKEADVICIDGSLVARTNGKGLSVAGDMVKKYGSSVFISKSSESRGQFGALGSRAGDIYYYNRASNHATGFSAPVEVKSEFAQIFEVYARLKEHTPMVRIEVLGSTSEQELKSLLDRLSYHSVGGYPYCLKLAHNNCKVSNDDIDKLVSIFSLQHEQGARDALDE